VAERVVTPRLKPGTYSLGIESILAADCGSAMTSVVLIERVAAEGFRLIARGEAPSTFEAPWSDVTLGVRCAIGQIEELAARRLLDDQANLITPQQPGGEGVDAFVIASSAGAPLRMVLMGLTRDLSLSSARYAAMGTYTVIEDILAMEDVARKGGLEAQIATLHQARPEVILMVGGTDQGARQPIMEAARFLSLACSTLDRSLRPQVVFAGNTDLRPQIAEILGPALELRAVDNVRPSLNMENTAAVLMELDNMYQERKMNRVPGFGVLSAWSPVPAIPPARAFSYVIRYLAEYYQRNVIGVDLGSMATTLVAAFNKQSSLVVRSDLGIGYSVGGVLAQTSIENILRWVPVEMDPTEARSVFYNKELHPATVPQTREELLLEQALAREAMRLTLQDARQRWAMLGMSLAGGEQRGRNLIVGTGRLLTRTPVPGQAALMLLDTIQPVGVSDLVLDQANLVIPLGAVATLQPLAAAQVTERDAFLELATVVVPIGTAKGGETALAVRVIYGDGRTLEVEVPFGSLEAIPLRPGEEATLELRPGRQFDVGRGRGRAAETSVTGSIAGVLIDARGRPLILPSDPEVRRGKVQEWMWNVGA
jgi:uncharacterized protein (TIGR01319 family)